ncbi:universal stress protein [Megalodesulfovibrio paquesii]
MERILVGIDAAHPSQAALLRALRLAARIQASVDVLVVFGTAGMAGIERHTASGATLLRRVEAAMEEAAIPGGRVRLFVAEGRFDEEVIAAARHMKTTLLVAGAPAAELVPIAEQADGKGREPGEPGALQRIFNSVDCRVELVSPKKTP